MKRGRAGQTGRPNAGSTRPYPRGGYGTWKPVTDFEIGPGAVNLLVWDRACELAIRGQTDKLIALLRDPKRTLPMNAREFLAQLVLSDAAGRSMIKRRRGRRAQLEDEDITHIHAIVAGQDWGKLRGALIEDLAAQYHVSPTTIREIAAARRKRYRGVIAAHWRDPLWERVLATEERYGTPAGAARLRRLLAIAPKSPK